MGPGWSWTYDTTDPLSDGGVALGSKVVTVQVREAVPGKTGVTAWRLHTLVPGSQTQLTWQDETAAEIVRHRDDAFLLDGGVIDSTLYAPSKLRLHTSATDVATNATYTESYTETVTTPGMAPSTATRNITWRVINGAEQVTVPAGTFTAVHLERKRGATADKEYWFVRGVGKVRELAIGTGRVEVLRSSTHP
jgi:hypothetical protein